MKNVYDPVGDHVQVGVGKHAPVVKEVTVPAGHPHAVPPAIDTCPLGHGVHALAPMESLYAVGPHGVHSPPSVEN